MKRLVLGLCFMLFASGVSAKEFSASVNFEKYNLVKTEYFENGFAVIYGCSVYIAWHDSHGSYSNTWSFPNVNSQSGCNQMKDELIAVLMQPVMYAPLNDEELLPAIVTPEEIIIGYDSPIDGGLLPFFPVDEGEMGFY
ncbi:hypothetical protein OIU83_16605 [Flavobacterium sp. LS1R49]|uniref:Uncharacterized protein n=1 Tax=Flavobacterium shii TaxID=2987687 RepID=A0A9X3BYT7_9FLAO|nr:hypothetical protein [Flavobacterium shii]MCV9929290.1 hypothetical protein [Flavobacterium shii]